MKKSLLIAGAAVFAIAVPAIAAQSDDTHHPMREMMMKDMTRADVEAKVKERFAMTDANSDGAITRDEIQARRDAMRTEMMGKRFEKMDTDNNGSISRAEFAAAHSARHDRMAMKDGKGEEGKPHHRMGRRGHHGMGMMGGMGMDGRMFDKADADHDGKVTLAEATSAALAHFDKVDADGNGTVTAAERMDYWKTRKAEWRAKKSTS